MTLNTHGMRNRSNLIPFLSLCLALTVTCSLAWSAGDAPADEMRFIQVAAKTKEDRSRIVDMGMSIEAVRSDSVWGFANGKSIKRLSDAGIPVIGNYDYKVGERDQPTGERAFDFPPADARFHNFSRTVATLQDLHNKHSDITKLETIGKSVEGRDLWALHINTTPASLQSGTSAKPGAVFMGDHHAREHVSVEIPLMFAQYLLDNLADPKIAAMIDSRDIWIIPMVNPDGAEYDIQNGTYAWWRKNRRNNGDGTYGVDLNRNYGFEWGTGGSDKDTSSDIYMGPAPFSEPETLAVKNFIDAHLNTKVLLTFHTFSELVLYPWGHTYDAVGTTKDLDVFKKMATTMAAWNHYTAEQSSALYIASGDTTDWAYGAHGIFAFTFELSPSSMSDGGFYPGAAAIDKVFNDNLKPCLYLLDTADDPYKVTQTNPTGFLRNYVEPSLSEEAMWNDNPLTSLR